MTQIHTAQAAAQPWSLTVRRLVVAGLASGIPVSLIVLATEWKQWGVWAGAALVVSTVATAVACAGLLRREPLSPARQWLQRRMLIASAAYAGTLIAATEIARLVSTGGALGQALQMAPIVAILAAIWLTPERKPDPRA